MTPKQCAARPDIPQPRHRCTCARPIGHWISGKPEDVVHKCRCGVPYTTTGEEEEL